MLNNAYLLPVAAGLLWLAAKAWDSRIQFAVAGEDADMKIANGHFSGNKSREDASEQAAKTFLQHKESGNIDKARELGKTFALAVIELDRGPLAAEMKEKALLIQHHLYLLYTYVANRVIAEYSPDSILAQTSLNVFYSEVEKTSEDLYRHISDTAAFSLYILCERSQNRSDDELGVIFAELCGAENDSSVIDYGNRMYRTFYSFCKDQIQSVPYQLV